MRNENVAAPRRVLTTAAMAYVALFTAITCVLAPMAVPIGPVPVSLTNLVIFFSVYILGWKQGTLSYVLYLLIGMAGLPVFSGFTGGVGKLAGPTGGYLAGFILTALISGLAVEKFSAKRIPCIAAMIVGMAVAYVFGTAWFCFSTGSAVGPALGICVLPFIPGDLAKIVLAAVAGPRIRKQLKNSLYKSA